MLKSFRSYIELGLWRIYRDSINIGIT